MNYPWKDPFLVPLPFRAKELPQLPESFASLENLSAHQVLQRLRSRWSAARSPALHRFCKRLLAAELAALVACDQGYSLQFARTPHSPTFKAYRNPSTYYLGPGLRRAAVLSQLRNRRMRPARPLVEFLTFFDAFREREPYHAGNFLPVSQWRTLEHELSGWSLEAEDRTRVPPWRDSFVIFYGSNGDLLVLSRQLRTAWFSHEDYTVEEVAPTFEEFLAVYVDQMDRFYPFSSFFRDYPPGRDNFPE